MSEKKEDELESYILEASDEEVQSALSDFASIERNESMLLHDQSELNGVMRGKKAYGRSWNHIAMGLWDSSGGLSNYMRSQTSLWMKILPIAIAVILVGGLGYGVSSNPVWTRETVDFVTNGATETVFILVGAILVVVLFLVMRRLRSSAPA